MNQQIIPMLSYENGVEAMKWLCDVFGFQEKTKWLDDAGRLTHGEIAMGESIIMLATPTPDYQSPATCRNLYESIAKTYSVPYIINGILVYVDDVESHFKNAKANGVTILSEIETGGPGTRYRAEDLEGQRWMFMQKSES
jgi:PhnB protein